MSEKKYDITIEYSESDGILTVTQNGIVKKTRVKRDRWGAPELKYVDLSYLAVQLAGGTGKGDYWILDADEERINKQRQERDHSFVIRHIGKMDHEFADGYLQTHYLGNEDTDSCHFLNGNPHRKNGIEGGSISSAEANIIWDAYFLGVDGQEMGLIPKLPLYLEFINHKNRSNNETFLRFEFVDREQPEWEAEWVDEDSEVNSDDIDDEIAWLRFA